MKNWYCVYRCSRLSRIESFRNDVLKPLRFISQRNYATRQPPGGFGANQPSYSRSRPSNTKTSTFESNEHPENPSKTLEEEASEDQSKIKSRRKFRIGPGKIVFFSLFSFIGYKVYTWQTDPQRSVILNPRFFTPFILEARDKVSSTSSILSLLSVPKGQNTVNVAEAWKTGIWSVQVMQPELQIARAYTPLPPASGDAKPELLRLFVRQEPKGEVSTFLHRINRGTLVHLRGPHLEYEIPKDVGEVLFIAGGTGITPALQVAHVLFEHRIAASGSEPRLQILWANRRREDSFRGLEPSLPQQVQEGVVPKLKGLIERWQGKPQIEAIESGKGVPPVKPIVQTPLVEEVEALRSRYEGNVSIKYFVDEESSFINERTLKDHLDNVGMRQPPNDRPKKLILISGPERFVSFYAGAKSMMGGKEIQGSLGGMLRRVDPKDWDVWKL